MPVPIVAAPEGFYEFHLMCSYLFSFCLFVIVSILCYKEIRNYKKQGRKVGAKLLLYCGGLFLFPLATLLFGVYACLASAIYAIITLIIKVIPDLAKEEEWGFEMVFAMGISLLGLYALGCLLVPSVFIEKPLAGLGIICMVALGSFLATNADGLADDIATLADKLFEREAKKQ